MTPGRLGEALGEVPAPRGSWEHEAVYVSAVAVRAPAAARRLAGRLRRLPGVAEVRERPNGMLEIVVTDPGEIVTEIIQAAPRSESAAEPHPGWPDTPRTWDNPGFVVRYAHARAVAVERWARDLGVPADGPMGGPDALAGAWDRAVLRVLAELPSRRARGRVGWASYLVRLALAYHDAHERAPAVPMGDRPVTPVHAARVRLARAVRRVLAEGLSALGETPPDRL